MRDFSVDELTSRRSEAMLSSHHKILSLNADNDNVKIKIVKGGEGIYIDIHILFSLMEFLEIISYTMFKSHHNLLIHLNILYLFCKILHVFRKHNEMTNIQSSLYQFDFCYDKFGMQIGYPCGNI